jgi:hypothetical protein
MDTQIQELKKQRKQLIVACCILVMALFFVSIYAFVQGTVAREMQKLVTKGMIRNVECEKEAMMQKRMAETAVKEALAAREEALRNSQR